MKDKVSASLCVMMSNLCRSAVLSCRDATGRNNLLSGEHGESGRIRSGPAWSRQPTGQEATVRWKGSEGSKLAKHTTRKLTPW